MLMPVLDPKPSGVPHDWNFSRIAQVRAAKGVRPSYWKNPLAEKTAPRDQKDRGTCVGQSTAYLYDILYMDITKDLPTESDKQSYKKDVVDQLGTTHDVLYPQSASAEAFYQISRKIGNVTYPSGSEIRFSSRAWINYGMNLEKQWHTDKTGHAVWSYPPGPRKTTDGGITPEEAEKFAAIHKAEGYAQVGVGAEPEWEEVCEAIWQKGAILGAIPVYENYSAMAGGDGGFPDPSGALAGFHALCFYGYDTDRLYFLHSWGDWCGRFGYISKRYYNHAKNLIQFFVIMDDEDVRIARELYKSVTISTNVPATVAIDSVDVGVTPQRVAFELGREYHISVRAEGYFSKSESHTFGDESTDLSFVLEPTPKPSWFRVLIEWILRLLRMG